MPGIFKRKKKMLAHLEPAECREAKRQYVSIAVALQNEIHDTSHAQICLMNATTAEPMAVRNNTAAVM